MATASSRWCHCGGAGHPLGHGHGCGVGNVPDCGQSHLLGHDNDHDLAHGVTASNVSSTMAKDSLATTTAAANNKSPISRQYHHGGLRHVLGCGNATSSATTMTTPSAMTMATYLGHGHGLVHGDSHDLGHSHLSRRLLPRGQPPPAPAPCLRSGSSLPASPLTARGPPSPARRRCDPPLDCRARPQHADHTAVTSSISDSDNDNNSSSKQQQQQHQKSKNSKNDSSNDGKASRGRTSATDDQQR